MAVATANSKKLLAPISVPGAARVPYFKQAHQAIRQRGIEIDLDQNGYGDQHNMQIATGDVVCLKGKDKYESCRQCQNRYWTESRQEYLQDRTIVATKRCA